MRTSKQDAGPGPDEESDDEDDQKEPSTGPGLEEAGGASEGGGHPCRSMMRVISIMSREKDG